MRRRYWALVLVLVLTACGQGQPLDPEPKPEPIPAPAPAPTPAPQEPVAAPASSSKLLPQEGVHTFYLTEGFGGPSRPVEEEWVREGNRLLATQGGGRPYVTWLLEPDGVWRPDPQNPQVLLRYLPPELKDGLIWRQQSGSDWVWFRLRYVSEPYQEWVLTVLNRGERSDWRFDRYTHQVAADSPKDPFAKMGVQDLAPIAVPAERKAEILAAAALLPTAKAPVAEGNAGAFVEAMRAQGYTTKAIDFTGDSVNEVVMAAFDRPTWFNPELLNSQADVTAEIQFHGTRSLQVVNLGGRPRLVALNHFLGGSLQIAWFEVGNEAWHVKWAQDIGPKLIGWTPATRAEALSDGRLRIEWEPLRDPAGHRRVRHLRLTEDGHVEWLDESWGPRGESLRDPQGPQELLQALFFTEWFGLYEEAARYFAGPAVAASFPSQGRPYAFAIEGEVGIGRVEANCQTVKEELPASGPIPFWALIGGYEGALVTRGTAQVGKAPDGRWVIESIELGETCDTY